MSSKGKVNGEQNPQSPPRQQWLSLYNVTGNVFKEIVTATCGNLQIAIIFHCGEAIN